MASGGMFGRVGRGRRSCGSWLGLEGISAAAVPRLLGWVEVSGVVEKPFEVFPVVAVVWELTALKSDEAGDGLGVVRVWVRDCVFYERDGVGSEESACLLGESL